MSDQLRRAEALVERPSESLSVELKNWIDPTQTEGIEKIVKAALALRNNNGGYLLIGFDDKTCNPITDKVPQNVREAFHPENIQRIIAKFSSEPFEVAVEFPQLNGQPFPVIIIPSGVKTPVAAKDKLIHNGSPLIAYGDLYVRTLHANARPSTAKATYKDWAQILEICFDNREADIGRFFRRHLNNLSPELIKGLASSLMLEQTKPEPTIRERLQECRGESERHFSEAILERKMEMPPYGSWEVVLIISGESRHKLNRTFLNLIISSNPHYTGWAPWFIHNASESKDGPYIRSGAWECLVPRQADNNIDFMRFSPEGVFYFRRTLQEDMIVYSAVAHPGFAMDSFLAIMRTAEAIAVGIKFAKAMGCPPEQTVLSYLFRWTNLRGRRLLDGSRRRVDTVLGVASHEDECISFVDVPLETPISAIEDHVYKVTQDLFTLFGGFEAPRSMVRDAIRETLEKRS